jgi:hypothetical protein
MDDLATSSTGRKLAIAFGPWKSRNILAWTSSCQAQGTE